MFFLFFEEFQTKRTFNGDMLTLLLQELLILLYRHMPATSLNEENFDVICQLQQQFQPHP